LINDLKEEKIISIFCAAHSSEPRQNFFTGLAFLWDHGFSGGHLTTPRPLFFSSYLNGVFYQGVEGYNLHHYLYHQDRPEIERVVALSGRWFAKLHSLKIKGDEIDFRDGFIPAVIPGLERVFSDIRRRYPHYLPFYERVYRIFIDNESRFQERQTEKYLVHGDAHPDNIIKVDNDTLALIDFNDLAIGDPARDLGCFWEQLEYMGQKEGLDGDYMQSLKQLFFDNYFANSRVKRSEELEERIDNYYNWTMLRTTTYQLMSNLVKRDENKLKRINHRINKLKDNLGL